LHRRSRSIEKFFLTIRGVSAFMAAILTTITPWKETVNPEKTKNFYDPCFV